MLWRCRQYDTLSGYKTVFSIVDFERTEHWRVVGTADRMCSRHAFTDVIYVPYTLSKNVAQYPPEFDSSLLPENTEKGLSSGRISEALEVFTEDSE